LAIFTYKFARFIGCLVLLALSLVTFILEVREEHSVGADKVSWRQHRKSYHPHNGYIPFSRAEWLQFALCMTAVSSLPPTSCYLFRYLLTLSRLMHLCLGSFQSLSNRDGAGWCPITWLLSYLQCLRYLHTGICGLLLPSINTPKNLKKGPCCGPKWRSFF
jgi:hypothetical protein